MKEDHFKSRHSLTTKQGKFSIYRLDALEKAGLTTIRRLPYSIRVMLEAALRQCNDHNITQEDVITIAAWKPVDPDRPGIPFLPARVIMQDFTGVPAIVTWQPCAQQLPVWAVIQRKSIRSFRWIW